MTMFLNDRRRPAPYATSMGGQPASQGGYGAPANAYNPLGAGGGMRSSGSNAGASSITPASGPMGGGLIPPPNDGPGQNPGGGGGGFGGSFGMSPGVGGGGSTGGGFGTGGGGYDIPNPGLNRGGAQFTGDGRVSWGAPVYGPPTAGFHGPPSNLRGVGGGGDRRFPGFPSTPSFYPGAGGVFGGGNLAGSPGGLGPGNYNVSGGNTSPDRRFPGFPSTPSFYPGAGGVFGGPSGGFPNATGGMGASAGSPWSPAASMAPAGGAAGGSAGGPLRQFAAAGGTGIPGVAGGSQSLSPFGPQPTRTNQILNNPDPRAAGSANAIGFDPRYAGQSQTGLFNMLGQGGEAAKRVTSGRGGPYDMAGGNPLTPAERFNMGLPSAQPSTPLGGQMGAGASWAGPESGVNLGQQAASGFGTVPGAASGAGAGAEMVQPASQRDLMQQANDVITRINQGDTTVSPRDALRLINRANASPGTAAAGGGTQAAPAAAEQQPAVNAGPSPMVDVTGRPAPHDAEDFQQWLWSKPKTAGQNGREQYQQDIASGAWTPARQRTGGGFMAPDSFPDGSMWGNLGDAWTGGLEPWAQYGVRFGPDANPGGGWTVVPFAEETTHGGPTLGGGGSPDWLFAPPALPVEPMPGGPTQEGGRAAGGGGTGQTTRGTQGGEIQPANRNTNREPGQITTDPSTGNITVENYPPELAPYVAWMTYLSQLHPFNTDPRFGGQSPGGGGGGGNENWDAMMQLVNRVGQNTADQLRRYNEDAELRYRLGGELLDQRDANVYGWSGESGANLADFAKGRYDTGMDIAGNIGEADLRAVSDLYTKERARADSDMFNRGLGNTTVRESVQSGLNRGESNAYGDALQRIAQMRLQTHAGLSGDQMALQERLHNQRTDLLRQLPMDKVDWIQSKDPIPPDVTGMMELALRAGQSGVGSGGFGGAPIFNMPYMVPPPAWGGAPNPIPNPGPGRDAPRGDVNVDVRNENRAPGGGSPPPSQPTNPIGPGPIDIGDWNNYGGSNPPPGYWYNPGNNAWYPPRDQNPTTAERGVMGRDDQGEYYVGTDGITYRDANRIQARKDREAEEARRAEREANAGNTREVTAGPPEPAPAPAPPGPANYSPNPNDPTRNPYTGQTRPDDDPFAGAFDNLPPAGQMQQQGQQAPSTINGSPVPPGTVTLPAPPGQPGQPYYGPNNEIIGIYDDTGTAVVSILDLMRGGQAVRPLTGMGG